ncbi:hypothetical protein QBC35DRAFT_299716 [Podospora australis]|uniref:DUF7357 domain-containing protein n=1 Tax=Podospora australis TaxID=1536484 RepID=A0AAN6WP89_9PEZI|nr:hypothetical protein QBC35DRAFT_299716 [Podospora australis]
MRQDTMRLRLLIRRHALPEVRIVFSCKTENDPTIAGLLEQVNEIIPLESSEWGLEDYAVELRKDNGTAFDCLHFQPVTDVLRNDEEVYIRPLATEDRRKRRLSGREQISADGRHLIDGIAFGRPRLRAPRDRPTVEIPPLKRRRIAYESEDDDPDDDQDPQLLITQYGEPNGRQSHGSVRFSAEFDDADQDPDADEDYVEDNEDEEEEDVDLEDEVVEDEDEDLDMDDLDDDDLASELRDLQNDMQDADIQQKVDEGVQEGTASPSTSDLNLERLDMITALRAAFPHSTFETLEEKLRGNQYNLRQTYAELRITCPSVMHVKAMMQHYRSLRNQAATGNHDDQKEDFAVESDAESVESVIKHYDHHGFPTGSVLAGTASKHMALEMQKAGQAVKIPVHTKFDEDESEDGSDEGHDDDLGDSSSASSDDNDDDGESDSGPEVASSKMHPPLPESDDDDADEKSDSDESSNNSDESDAVSENHSDQESEADADVSDSDSDGGMAIDSDDAGEKHDHQDSDDDSDGDESDDGNDANASDAADDSDDQNDDGSSDSSSDDQADSSSDDDATQHSDNAGSEDSSDDDSASSDSADSSSDGPSSDDSSSDEDSPDRSVLSSPTLRNSPFKKQVPDPSKNAESQKQRLVPTNEPPPIPPGHGKLQTRKRNARRRLLKQAQQIGATATAAASTTPQPAVVTDAVTADIEASIAAKKAQMLKRLEGFTELLVQGLSSETNKKQEEPASAPCPVVQEALDAWRDKINYTAVECCQEGVDLSEPPFPFVQRWDPQQQYNSGRAKRKQRNQADYQDDHSAKRRRHNDYDDSVTYAETTLDYDESMVNGDTTLNYDDEPQQDAEQASHSQDQEDSEEDLPPLPADLASLPSIHPSEAKPDMVITWKQFLLSRATNWTPQVVSLTGMVVSFEGDSNIRLRLAKRDQNLDRNEKVYDEDGNRVYDKFELPASDDDEQEDEEDEGYRTLEFSEMLDTRVLQHLIVVVPGTPTVQPAPESQVATRLCDGGAYHGPKETISAHTSATMGREEMDQRTDIASQMEIDTATTEESVIPETNIGNVVEQPPAQISSIEDISMTEERRHEISQLINEAGFRKEVDLSITKDARSDRSSNSPSRQLENTLQQATAAPLGAMPFVSSQPQSQVSSVSASQATSNGVDSQPIHLEPFDGFSDAITLPSDNRVEYHKLDLPPSDIRSVHSGRQVDPGDYSVDLRDSSFNASEDDAASPPGSDNESDDSLPSLGEILTQNSRRSSNASQRADITSAFKARKPAANRHSAETTTRTHRTLPREDFSDDEDFSDGQEAKDQGSDAEDKEDDDNQASVSGGSNVEDPADNSDAESLVGVAEHKRLDKVKTEPLSSQSPNARRVNPPRKARGSGGSSQFYIPEGSQVVSLLSSSPEPVIEENYAEDDIDETYEDTQDSGFPDSGNWVSKKGSRGVPTSSFGPTREKVSVPKRFASSQQPVQQKPTAYDSSKSKALENLLKAKKKMSARPLGRRF